MSFDIRNCFWLWNSIIEHPDPSYSAGTFSWNLNLVYRVGEFTIHWSSITPPVTQFIPRHGACSALFRVEQGLSVNYPSRFRFLKRKDQFLEIVNCSYKHTSIVRCSLHRAIYTLHDLSHFVLVLTLNIWPLVFHRVLWAVTQTDFQCYPSCHPWIWKWMTWWRVLGLSLSSRQVP